VAAIFISHATHDSAVAAEIKAWLDAQGYENVFLDFDKESGLHAGKEWERQLYENIERCHAVILVITPAWMASSWCISEARIARLLGKSIFPIIRTPDDVKIIGPELQSIQAELWNTDGKAHLGRRLEEIAAEIARGYRYDRSRAPWPGIYSLEAEDAAIFFGRDPEIRKVAELLEARRVHGGARLLLIVGASGSGKSSLMKAGVLPYATRDAKRFVAIPPFRPGALPLLALSKSLAEAIGRPGEWPAVEAGLSIDARSTLLRLVEEMRVGPAREATVLLAIDQFEEVFTVAAPEERRRFIDLLAAATDRGKPLPVLAIATVRSDLLGEILKERSFGVAHEAWTLGPLPPERLADIIDGPARVAAIRLEPGLSARILKDVGSPEALPLLAFALRELYERHGRDKRLSVLEYEALGDPAAGLSPLDNAIRRKAEETLAAAAPSAEETAALKEAFVGGLVKVNEDGVRLRRPARLDELPEAARPLLQGLVEARLLSTRSEGDARLVEVAHEALFRAWPLLSAWLEEEQDFLIGRRQIEDAERTWAAAPAAQKEKALLAGLLLEKAREWMLAFPHRLSGVRDYVLASIRKDDAERAKARRRLRMLMGATAAAAALFVLLGLAAAYQWRQAGEQRQVAAAAADAANASRAAAEAERSRAEEESRRADAERQRAEEERQAALAAQDLAGRQRQLAEEARIEAEESRYLAEQERRRADEERRGAEEEQVRA
jgi:hypothetical protein